LQRLRAVLLGFEADGVEEDVASHPVTEQVLYADEIRRHRWTDALTPRVDHVDDDDPVADEVVVETNRLVVLGAEDDVRESGRDRGRRSRATRLGGPGRRPGTRDGSRSEAGQEVSAVHG